MLIRILLLTVLGITSAAHAADAGRIVVTNARLIGRDVPSKDIHVNLLIVGGTLVVVTKDDLVMEPGDVAVDCPSCPPGQVPFIDGP